MTKTINALVEKMEKLQETNAGTLKGGFASITSGTSLAARARDNNGNSCTNSGDCTKSVNDLACTNSGTCLAL